MTEAATTDSVRGVEHVIAFIERHRSLLPLATFGFGLGSFLLIQRNEWLAQWIAGLLLVGWLLMLFEGLLGRWLAGGRWARLSPLMLRLAMQQIHQETFFFCLPFFLATTTWLSAQAVFTSALIVSGPCSMWDPLYFHRIAARPWLYLGFHALAMYTAALTVPPLLWQMTTTQTLALASVAIAVLTAPSLAKLIPPRHPSRWLLLIAGAAAFGAVSWFARGYVPPATLWLRDAALTRSVDTGQRRPGAALKQISAAKLADGGGLYAFGAIHAPRGLHEQVYHRWLFDGKEMDRIPLTIVGGRESGYRVWSYKQSFPAESRGGWEVQVVTESGQLIGLMRFDVTD